jgi:hypothetical protein
VKTVIYIFSVEKASNLNHTEGVEDNILSRNK